MTDDDFLWNAQFEQADEEDTYYKEERIREIYYEKKYNDKNDREQST